VALAGPTAADEKKEAAPVSGTFTGNGKEAKLAFASAANADGGKGGVVLIFSEKDHSKVKNARGRALFGDFGSALIIVVTAEGKVIGCTVVHAAHKRSGFSFPGAVKTADFKVADGKVSGKLSTGGEKETFGDKWTLDVRFDVKLP
jgi:hypothetical protein